MVEIKDRVDDVAEYGGKRLTRSGVVSSLFGTYQTFYPYLDYFPIPTSKQIFMNTLMGELLWFLSGSTDLDELRRFSCKEEGAWTIWTNDCERWGGKGSTNCGKIYGHQWRNFSGELGKLGTGVDQISNLINGLKEDPHSRYHRVTAWNPLDMQNNELCLPACHTDFQCYVDRNGKLDMHWNQRSCDVFLGLPYNIPSYSMLLLIIAKLVGREAGVLTCWIGDYHVYDNHGEAVEEYLSNPTYSHPSVEMPEFSTLEELLQYTAEDFKLIGYEHAGVIKAPLSVG